jgi:hypothetical protein
LIEKKIVTAEVLKCERKKKEENKKTEQAKKKEEF